jgi:hypothetical protein
VNRNLGPAAIDQIKSFTMGVLASVKEQLLSRLKPEAIGASVNNAVNAVFNAFAGLKSEREEAAARKKILPIAQPVERLMGHIKEKVSVEGGKRTVIQTKPAYIWEVPFEEALSKLIRNDDNALKQIISSAKRWRESVACKKKQKRTAKNRCGAKERVWSDIEDGDGFQSFITQVDRDSPEGAVPLAIILYYDGLEVVNGLGHARGTHKLGCFYYAFVNLGQETRMDLENIYLHGICLEKDISQVGPEMVISGGDYGGQCDVSSWGFSMRALMNGEIKLKVPNATSCNGYSRLG